MFNVSDYYHLTAIHQNIDGTRLQSDKDITIDSPEMHVDMTMILTIILKKYKL